MLQQSALSAIKMGANKNTHQKSEQAATLIELLLTIGIISIIAASTSPFMLRFLYQSHLDTTTDKVISTITKAQHYSFDEKGAGTWGICITGNAIRLFTGTCASPDQFEDFSIPQTTTVSGILETTFTSTRGEPQPSNGCANILISNPIGSKTIQVNEAGGITIP